MGQGQEASQAQGKAQVKIALRIVPFAVGTQGRFLNECIEGVVSAVEDQFAQWTTPNDTLRRLCAITYDALFS